MEVLFEKCKHKCCSLKKYKSDTCDNDFNMSNSYKINNNLPKYPRKAGVLVYDPETNKVLLIESRGMYWGIPKGSLENN